MTRSILVCERDPEFRANLCNFLLSAGYSGLDCVATVREVLPRLRSDHYRFILVGLSPPLSMARWLARLVHGRQPEARVVFLIRAIDAPSIADASLVYALKERAFGALAELLPEPAGGTPPEALN